MDRSGYARGTLAPREGMSAEVPPLEPRALLTMSDMGMDHGAHAGHDAAGSSGRANSADHSAHGAQAGSAQSAPLRHPPAEFGPLPPKTIAWSGPRTSLTVVIVVLDGVRSRDVFEGVED